MPGNMSNLGGFGSFELNSIIRGAQLTLVGAFRALQNPGLFTSQHYRQAALAIAAGLAIRLLVAIPTFGIRVLVRFVGLFTDLETSSWDEDVIEGIHFIEHSVLQIPFFLMTMMRHYSPAMDNMFMDSLQWVDQTYLSKHKAEDPAHLRAMYYPTLRMYNARGLPKPAEEKRNFQEHMHGIVQQFGKRAGLSLGVYLLSFVPYIGRFVLPAASFYTFNQAVGLQPAALIFGSSLLLPKRYLVTFLQSYFSSRRLMRELLEPYFSRIRYTKQQKELWFRDRAGVLYGFAVAFFFLIKVPLLGVLIYGVAEASTAFLITKITDPPPSPPEVEEFKKRDVHWENKHEFLSMPLDAMDKLNVSTSRQNQNPIEIGEIKGRQFA